MKIGVMVYDSLMGDYIFSIWHEIQLLYLYFNAFELISPYLGSDDVIRRVKYFL